MHSQELGALPRKTSKLFLSAALLCGTLAYTPLVALPTGDGGSTGTMSDAAVRSLVERFDQVMSQGILCGEACMKTGQCTSECVASHEAWKSLTVAFQKQPDAWKAVRPLFTQKFRAKETACEVKGRMLDFLAQGQAAECAELSVDLWKGDPQAFGADHLMAFASGGCEVFTKAVADGLAQTKCDVEKVYYAAFLAVRGDEAGRSVLEAALEPPCGTKGGLARAFVAAKALEKLGAPARIDKLTKKAHDSALAALDEGDVDHARAIALEASFGRESVSGAWMHLPYYENRLAWTLGTGSREFPDAESVFGLVEKLVAN